MAQPAEPAEQQVADAADHAILQAVSDDVELSDSDSEEIEGLFDAYEVASEPEDADMQQAPPHEPQPPQQHEHGVTGGSGSAGIHPHAERPGDDNLLAADLSYVDWEVSCWV